jgi:hypothetical protein
VAFSAPTAHFWGGWCGRQPQRRLGGLHGLVNRGQQLGRQRVQVDLVAEAGAERLDGPGGVVAAPVEAPIHRLLDAASGRLEQRRHGQGGAGHRPARRALPDPTEQLPEDQDQPGVAQAQDDGEGGIA